MIIVNQDKDIIVNFDNVDSIDIVADLDGTGEVPYKIYYETSAKREELGKYQSEKRAKKVLQEIVNLYIKQDLELLDMTHRNVDFPQVYEMPEE